MRPVGRGHRGKQVVDIQTRLAALGYFLGGEGADGFFGPHTENAIRAFQQTRLLYADGVVEDNTWTELVEAGYKPGERLLYLRVPYMRGDDVLYLQRALDELGFDSGPVDGIFTPALEVAVTEFQRNAGLIVDGIVGETTFDRLYHLRQMHRRRRRRGHPRPHERLCGQALAARAARQHRPGSRRRRPGVSSARAILAEKDLNLRSGRELAGSLESSEPWSTWCARDDSACPSTSAPSPPTPGSRTSTSASTTAGARSPKASGVAAYYFANSAYQSQAGKRLAGYIVDAL